MNRTILITGGAGFIGSHVVRLFVQKYPQYRIINADALTYAGNLENIKDIEKEPNYIFSKTNIVDAGELEVLFTKYQPDSIIHLAAESHVDRSILSPMDFVYTNVIGTVNLLNTSRKYWNSTTSNEKPNFSIIFPQMRFTALLEQPAFSPKKQNTIPIHLIALPKHPVIIL